MDEPDNEENAKNNCKDYFVWVVVSLGKRERRKEKDVPTLLGFVHGVGCYWQDYILFAYLYI